MQRPAVGGRAHMAEDGGGRHERQAHVDTLVEWRAMTPEQHGAEEGQRAHAAAVLVFCSRITFLSSV